MERPENQDLGLNDLTNANSAAFLLLGDLGLIIEFLLLCFLKYKIKITMRQSLPNSHIFALRVEMMLKTRKHYPSANFHYDCDDYMYVSVY